jgi:hypothetical protein
VSPRFAINMVQTFISKSFRKIENKNGSKFSPCLTPFSHLKKSDLQLLYTTHDLMLSYIFNIKQYQGVNLLPFLFSIFLNDLESYLQSKDVSGLITLSEEIENQLNVYLKLFVILYADDTVIMSETKEDLQKQLDVFSEYCKFWQLKVNVEKTKILFFF